MEKHPNPFDDFVREAMKGHGLTPSGKARKTFLDEAPAALSPKRAWKKWYLIPLIIVFLGGTVAFFVFISEDRYQSSVDGLQSSVDSPHSSVDGLHSSVDSPQSLVDSPPSSVLSPQSLFDSLRSEISQISTFQEGYAPEATVQEPMTTDQQPLTTDQEPMTNDQPPMTTNQEPMTNDQQPMTNDQEPMTTDQEPISWRVSASGYYAPELMFNTLEGNKYVNNFGFEAIFTRGLVSLRTGVGLSVSKGITENAVNYNDYLGAYNKLDSMAFTFNEELNDFEPKFFMSSEKVWDSISQSDSTEIIKRYTYLQVPLVLGFDFWQKGRISVGVRVGTIMSVLLKSQQLTGEYDPGESLVIGVNQLTPSQVSTNWQAIGGIDVSAALTRRIGLEIEPHARYYYGSIYEKSGDFKKPWSLGIRAAIVYKF